MFYANTFTLKMENKKMAAKALEVMKEALAQIDADGFKYDSRETVDDFANDLMVKGSEVIAAGNCGLMPDANHIAIPEMFKAVARCFCFDKFTTKVFFDSDYEWEVFDISYEGGELVINSLYSLFTISVMYRPDFMYMSMKVLLGSSKQPGFSSSR